MMHRLLFTVWINLYLTGYAFTQDCSSPYQVIGDKCLFVDNDLVGTWEEIRAFCQAIDGDLVNLEDLNTLRAIYVYIMEHVMDNVSYWTGATDIASEGDWIWCQDGMHVRKTMPLWGDDKYDVMYPSGSTIENCGILQKEEYFYMDDTACDELHATICETVYVDLNETQGDSTIAAEKAIGCVHPFQLIGNACLLIDTLNPNTYATKELMCQELGGHMAKITDANLLARIYDFIQLNGLDGIALYIGATDPTDTGTWKWHDGSLVQLGTPFWGDLMIGGQRPNNVAYQNCTSLSNIDHFFFHDVDCEVLRGVICQQDP